MHQADVQIGELIKKLRVGIKPESKVIARANTKIFNDLNNERHAIIVESSKCEW